MPVVQKLTLNCRIGSIPKGTEIKIVTPDESTHLNSGILSALRKSGFTDDQFDSNITKTSNWTYRVMREEDPGELNLQLARFSRPIYNDYELDNNRNTNRNRIVNVNGNFTGNVSANEPILTGGYWDFWKKTLGSFFWIAVIFLFPLWIVCIILKFIFKFCIWCMINVINICTFGLFDLGRDWDDIFD